MYSLTETKRTETVEGKLYLTQVRILKAPVKRKRTTRKYIFTLDNNGFLIKICKIKNLDCFFLLMLLAGNTGITMILTDFTSRASLFYLTINSTTIIRRLYYLIMLNGYQI